MVKYPTALRLSVIFGTQPPKWALDDRACPSEFVDSQTSSKWAATEMTGRSAPTSAQGRVAKLVRFALPRPIHVFVEHFALQKSVAKEVRSDADSRHAYRLCAYVSLMRIQAKFAAASKAPRLFIRPGKRGGMGFQLAIASTHNRACSLLSNRGKCRRSSTMAASSPCSWKAWRIASATAGSTANMLVV